MKSLLSINMRTISYIEAKGYQAKGVVFKPASLYEPEHAPKGTQFVMVQSAINKNGSPYRVTKGRI